MIVFIALLSMGAFSAFAQTGRLPDALAPKSYVLNLEINMEQSTFAGMLIIEIKCEKPTKQIVLNSKELTISQKDVKFNLLESEKLGKEIALQPEKYDTANDFYILPVSEDLVVNSVYQLFIPYSGKIRDDSQGFFKISYTDGGQPKLLALTLLVPNNARLVMPCFDEPFYKASFQITLTHDPKFNTASNMPLVGGGGSSGPGFSIVSESFDASPPLSTYVVAFMVSELTVTQYYDESLQFYMNIFVKKDFANQIEFAHKVSMSALKFFSTYFDYKYPSSKLDIGIIPGFPIASMENFGFINVSESPILLDEKTASIFNMYDAGYTICTEISNQWLGNLLTVAWWDDLWLTMAFGEYFSIIGLDNIFTEWKAADFGFLRKFQNTIEEDSLITSHPVVRPINDPKDINTLIFDSITFEKAPYLIRMTNLLLGEDNFKKSIATFLSKFVTATRDDLWTIMTDIAHTNKIIPQDLTIKAMMDTWLLQAGFPYLFVKVDYQNHKVIVSQERFFRKVDQKLENNAKPPCWILPLSFTTSLELKFETTAKEWLVCPNPSKPLEIPLSLTQNDWILFNIRMQAPIQILYEEPNCVAIQKTLNEEKGLEKIEVLSRVQMILDAFAFAWQGKLTYKIAFDFLQYLKSEKEYLPWRVTLRSLADIRYLLLRTKIFAGFEKFVTTLLEPKFKEFGPITDLSRTVYIDTHFKTFVVFWACSYYIKDCQTQSVKVFEDWMASSNPDTDNPVPADLRETIYCEGARVKDEKYWNFLYDRYKNSKEPTELSKISAALACSSDIPTLEKYLNWSLIEANIRKEESAWVFSSVCDNDIAFDTVKKFLKDRFNDINKYHNGDPNTLTTYLTAFATLIISEEELNDFQTFWDSVQDKLQKVDRDTIIAKVNENIGWQKTHYDEMSKLLGS